MTLFIVLLVTTTIIVALVLWGIPWVRKQPWAAEYFWWLEPAAITLFGKSETIAWNRFKQLVGSMLTLFGAILPTIGSFDPTPFIPFLTFIPDEYRVMVVAVPSLALWLDGIVGVRLRKVTTEPAAVVALPMEKQDLPEVVQLREAKTQAVVAAKVEEAKTQGGA